MYTLHDRSSGIFSQESNPTFSRTEVEHSLLPVMRALVRRQLSAANRTEAAADCDSRQRQVEQLSAELLSRFLELPGRDTVVAGGTPEAVTVHELPACS